MDTSPRMLWAAVLLAVACVACVGSDFQWDTARQIRPGMTEDQVSTLMGPPSHVRTHTYGVTWTWAYVNPREGDARAVSVGFRDGQVVYGAGVPTSFK